MSKFFSATTAAAIFSAAGLLLSVNASVARPLSLASESAAYPSSVFEQAMPEERITDEDAPAALPDRFRRQIVNYSSREAPGTIVVDTPNTYLYYVLGNGQAVRYGIGVGRDGFTWSGTKTVERKAEWPDWRPPAEMIERQPYLPRFMAGGADNPLGARAMYLGGTVYRIHGTNAPSTIGHNVSSGCIRLINADVEDLYSRVNVGTKVVVLPMHQAAPVVAARPLPRTVASYTAY
jgi:lipoprotein-anchoring transpeptidase ErfK/SrfK